eukprot:1225631-Rhodomonas_salina.3
MRTEVAYVFSSSSRCSEFASLRLQQHAPGPPLAPAPGQCHLPKREDNHRRRDARAHCHRSRRRLLARVDPVRSLCLAELLPRAGLCFAHTSACGLEWQTLGRRSACHCQGLDLSLAGVSADARSVGQRGLACVWRVGCRRDGREVVGKRVGRGCALDVDCHQLQQLHLQPSAARVAIPQTLNALCPPSLIPLTSQARD